jgi:transcriptional regulator
MAKDKAEVLQGTLNLLVLKTVETMGPIHGWGIAKRIEQVSEDLLDLKYGTLYPALMKLEQQGWITSDWGVSDNNRRARFYSITKQGRKQLALETESWDQMASFIARVVHGAKERGS